MNQTVAEISYFQQRMDALGITDEINSIELWQHQDGKNVLVPVPVFTKHDRGIEILTYTLERTAIRVEKEGSRMKRNWTMIRLEKPITNAKGDTIKYLMPKGQGSYPFFPPALVKKFDEKQSIHTLVLTEGFFKAFKGSMHGIDIVGLASITHMKNRETGSLHPEILKLIQVCDVKRVVWLTDGDCLDITGKEITEEKDLYTRPYNFYNSCNQFKQLLDDQDCDKYFFHVNSEGIEGKPKGLDDLLIALPDKVEDIVADLMQVSSHGQYFQKFNITAGGLSTVRKYFRLNDVTDFYLFHSDRRTDLKGKKFRFHGTVYRYNEDEGKCEVVVPGAANNYFRVGDDYYKFIQVPNKYGQLERGFRLRRKSTIVDDHGKEFPKFIPKYEQFVTVPDHVNFQQTPYNCFNMYSPMEHAPEEDRCSEEDCPYILKFIKHIFGHGIAKFKNPKTKEIQEFKNWELGLDYVQLLYQRPIEKLPILCLVSKENNTGKSTFGKLLKQLFSGNCAIVGNQDLAGDFNSHWANKLLVICDETKIDKQHVVEKVKSLSTADKIMMNAKGRDHVEVDCYIKFIFITNNEETFVPINNEDIRYWVNKVPIITEENPEYLDNMIQEIPAFLSFLNGRKLVSERMNRMWFHPDLLKTDALKKVQQNSTPVIEKEIRQYIREMFFDFGVTEILMARKDVHKEFFNNRYEANYIERVLKDHLKLDLYHKLDESEKDLFGNPVKRYCTTRYSYPRWEERFDDGKKNAVMVDVHGIGRPYVFKRDNFLTPEEIAQIVVKPGQIAGIEFSSKLNQPPVDPGKPADELPF